MRRYARPSETARKKTVGRKLRSERKITRSQALRASDVVQAQRWSSQQVFVWSVVKNQDNCENSRLKLKEHILCIFSSRRQAFP